ncbi:hypothetical protein [Muricoccus radiodurans]|uniref:hypothetical protein n=1 Tax=Muricoccus radiodurans TaxID=2231721 RepID=UPI003CF28E8D
MSGIHSLGGLRRARLPALPKPEGTAKIPFGAGASEEGKTASRVPGPITAASMLEKLSRMGAPSPILLPPAESLSEDAGLLRGIRLSVAVSPDAAPG